jgi:sugar lactone lactonase YvrE
VLVQWTNSTGTVIAGAAGVGVGANQLHTPYGLAFDSSDSLYIVDNSNNRVQKYLANASSGITVAGSSNGTSGTTALLLKAPKGIALDSNGNVYIADINNNRVQLWNASSSVGQTVAGSSAGKCRFRTPAPQHFQHNVVLWCNIYSLVENSKHVKA